MKIIDTHIETRAATAARCLDAQALRIQQLVKEGRAEIDARYTDMLQSIAQACKNLATRLRLISWGAGEADDISESNSDFVHRTLNDGEALLRAIAGSLANVKY